MKWLKFLGWSFLLVLKPVAEDSLRAEEVSRTPPEIYQQKLAPLLTPLEEVLKLDDGSISSAQSGCVLLDEEIEYMDESGKRYLLNHEVYRARTEAGAKQIEEDISGYRKGKQRIYLILARTILPDGSRQEVRPNAAILQTPQREADNNIYQDREELRLIFPNVKTGSVTELITLTEEDQFRIPGEFTSFVAWTRGWPLLRMRSTMDLPDSYANRLKIQTVGLSLPEVVISAPEPGRKRYLWETKNVPAVLHEENDALLAETGPIIYVSTLPDWDTFAAWYKGEMEKSGTLSPKLKALADEWTKDLKDPAAIQGVLLEKVANDIRYTGLNFGDSDLRPHTCDEVWENQYGDCKDKSNLLVALLKYKGIDADLVLLNTEHSGTVEKRSPDFRDFNHAIVAIGKTPQDFVYSDPTIGGCTVGTISPSSGDRDVLVIQNGKAVWAKTPPAPAGLLDYKFDLTLAPSGELSGWLTFSTTGYYGTGYNNLFRDLDNEERRSKIVDIVDSFYPGAEVIDFEVSLKRPQGAPFEAKVFFMVNVAKQNEGQSAALPFPHTKSFFVETGDNVQRRTSFFQWLDQTRVDATIHLPEGWSATQIPQPYQIQSKPLTAKVRWEGSGNTCHASLDLSGSQSVIPAAEFESFRKSVQALRSWLSKPLTISSSTASPNASSSPEITLENFPLMPTGRGQLDFVERRYPSSGNVELRRQALLKVLQLFPNDPKTQFSAQVDLAEIEWDGGKPAEAGQKITSALKTYGKDVDAETIAWADYILGLVRLDQDLDDEALKLFSKIAAQDKLKPYRRAWSSFQAGVILQKMGKAAEAKTMLEQALSLHQEVQPPAMAYLAELDYASSSDLFAKRLETFLAGQSEVKNETIIRLCKAARGEYFAKNPSQAQSLTALLNSDKIKAGLNQDAQDAVRKLQSGQAIAALGQKLQDQLKSYLQKNPWNSGTPSFTGKLERPALVKARDDAQKERKTAEASQRAMEILTQLPPSESYSFDLWKAAVLLEWKDRLVPNPPDIVLFNHLMMLLAQLPPEDDNSIDARFLQSTYYRLRNQPEKERAELLQIAALAKIPESYLPALYSKLGSNYEKSGKNQEALNQYKKLESLSSNSALAANTILRSVFINLELNRTEEALRLIGLMENIDADTLDKVSGAFYIREFMKLGKDPEKAKAYWQLWPQWWPIWENVLVQAGQKRPLPENFTYPEEPLTTIGEQLETAVEQKNWDDYWSTVSMLSNGAKWLPALCFELADALSYSSQSLPKIIPFHRSLKIGLFEKFPDDGSDLGRRARVQLAAHYYDSQQPEKMRVVMVKYFKENPENSDEMSQAMMRLRAILAVDDGNGIEEATLALEKLLASNVPMGQRGQNVYCLGILYSKAGNPGKEKELLEKELLRSDITALPEQAKKLRNRLTQMGASSEQSDKFSMATSNWLKKNPIPWLRWTNPETLEALDSKDLSDLVNNPGGQLSAAERIKLNLLICQDKDQPLELKTSAWINSFDLLMSACTTHSEADAFTQSVLQEESFPETTRRNWLWYALCDAFKNRGPFESYAKNPLAGTWNEKQNRWVELWRPLLTLDYSSPTTVQGALQKLTKGEMDEGAIEGFNQVFNQLLERGDLSAAETAYKLAGGVRMSADSSVTSASFQLQLLRALKNLRLSRDLHQNIREAVFKYFPEDKIIKPAGYDNLRDRHRSELLDPKTALDCILFEIKEGSFPRESLSFWNDFLDRLMDSSVPDKENISCAIAETALQHAPDDEWRADAVSLYLGAIDTDDEQRRSRWESQVKPFKDPEKWPKTNARIRIAELHQELRLGKEVDLETTLGAFKQQIDTEDALQLKLSQAWSRQDREAMRSLLSKMSAEELLHPRLLQWTLPSLEWTGMKDEADLAREKAQGELRKSAALSSMTSSGYFFGKSLNLADVIQNEKALPDGWMNYSISQVKNPRLLLRLQIDEAKRAKDWVTMEKLATEAVEKFPTFYIFYWDQGLALMENGKKEKARAALETYTQYSKNEMEYPEALKKLKQLSPTP